MSPIIKSRSVLSSQFFFFFFMHSILGFFYFLDPSLQASDTLTTLLYSVSGFFVGILSILYLFQSLIFKNYAYKRVFYLFFLLFWIRPLISPFIFLYSIDDLNLFEIFNAIFVEPQSVELYYQWLKIFAFSQFMVATFFLLYFRKKKMTTFLILHIPVKSKKNSISIVILKLILLPLFFFFIVLSYSINLFSTAVFQITGKFLSIDQQGVVSHFKTYEKMVNNQSVTVSLYPMSHIASSSFYNYIEKNIPSNTTIITEGVSDRKGLMKQNIAQTYQKVITQYQDPSIPEEIALSLQPPIPSKKRRERDNIQIIHGDLDLDQFDPQSIELLNNIFLHMNNQSSVTASSTEEYIKDLSNFMRLKLLYNDLIYSRNSKVVSILKEQESNHSSFTIPWGALHMRGIEKRILKEGYQLKEEVIVPILSRKNLQSMINKNN